MARRIIAMVVVGPLCLLALYRCSYLPLRCSVNVAVSERDLVAAAGRADNYASIVAARHALDRLRHCSIHPLEVDPPMLTALSYRFLQRDRASIAWYERALTIDRRPEIYLGLGVMQLRAGQREDGLRNLTLACAFAPDMLDGIEDGAARDEVKRRISAKYGADWLKSLSPPM